MTNILVDLQRRLAELENRVKNMTRYGKVVDVDGNKVKVEVSEDHITGWLQIERKAGNISISSPVHLGERVKIDSPNGQLEQGTVSPIGSTDDNESASDELDDFVIKNGDCSITMMDSEIILKVGDVHISLTAAGITQKADQIKLDGRTEVTKNFITKQNSHFGGSEAVALIPVPPSSNIFTT